MVFCCVLGCGNRHGRDKISFHRIPAVIKNQGVQTELMSQRRRDAWLSSISRVDSSNKKYWFVCSVHFVKGKHSYLFDDTNPDWTPTQKMGHTEGKLGVDGSDRYQRKMRRISKRKDLEAASVLVSLGTDIPQDVEQFEVTDTSMPENVIGDNPLTSEVECQTDIPLLSSEEVECQTDIPLLSSEVNKLEADNQRLLRDNTKLKQKLLHTINCHTLNQESFQNDNDKVKCYTGLPNFLILMSVFNFISKDIPSHCRSILTPFHQFILVLMKLRLNLSVVDLSYRFDISKSTVSSVFLRVLDVMYVKLKPLIHWPSREQLKKTMPMCFQSHFGTKVAVIVDCFEIFCDRPSNLMARNQTFSYYKHHSTVKYLIGICPQGVVSFLSQGWGGRTSDKYLTENCNFLDNLLPGDVVLADRGFDINESVGMMCAQVHLPAFTRGKKQLSPLDVEKTRRLANVRIHVERVIGEIRQKYRILESTLTIDYLISKNGLVPTVDKLVTVTCALVNMCDSVVPFE